MREIKFRAWEKNLKEMIPVHQIDFEKRMINTESAWRLFGEIELMQYTGLKDKKGVEIYENDIVNFHYQFRDNEPKTKVMVVEEDTVNPCFVLINPANGNELEYDFVKCGLATLEVIGNIYENPDLLEVAQ